MSYRSDPTVSDPGPIRLAASAKRNEEPLWLFAQRVTYVGLSTVTTVPNSCGCRFAVPVPLSVTQER